ncbi:MAG: Glutathione transport system permease protein GsiD [Chloroflexi bacterium ADurb.Bin325]|nr:MAG: Glutathione transport system permease protein GsiD [Chloroflexi bacterium ADurb.Bin325]
MTRLRRRARQQPLAALAAGVLLAILLAALLAPWLAPAPPDAIDLAAQLAPPSPAHPLGGDFYGRDLLSRILYGGRVTLLVATAAVTLAMVVGALVGLLAGYAQGWLGQVWVGLIDLLLAFPALLLALLVVALMGPGLTALAVAVGVASIPGYARLVRSLVLTLRSAPFVEAAVALGGAAPHILARHLLPAVVSPLLALATLDFGRAIISAAALGFLGLGAAPPTAEWGLMLYEGRGYLATAPWASAFPGLAITLTVLAVTILGDALTGPPPAVNRGRE